MRSIVYLCMCLISFGVFAQESEHVILSKELFEASIHSDTESLKRNIQLIDVRRPEEFEAGKIEGATNINVLEEEIDIKKLYQADEVWMTSSTKEIQPIRKIDERELNSINPLDSLWFNALSIFI